MHPGLVGLGSAMLRRYGVGFRDPPCSHVGRTAEVVSRPGCEGSRPPVQGMYHGECSRQPLRPVRGSALDVCRETDGYRVPVRSEMRQWPEAARCEEGSKEVGTSFPALAPLMTHSHWSDRPLLFRVSKQRVWDALTGPDFTSPHLCRSRRRRASRLSRTATPGAPRTPLFANSLILS